MLFYSTNDIRKPPSSVPCFVLQLKKEERRKFQLEFQSKPELPYWLHLQVFVNNTKFDDDNELAELHRGSGKCKWSELLSGKGKFTIFDSTGVNPIGYVYLNEINSPDSSLWFLRSKLSASDPLPNSVTIATELVRKFKRDVYESNQYQFDSQLQVFFAIQTPTLGESTPLVTWPILATQVIIRPGSEAFLHRVCKLGFYLQGYTDLSILSKLTRNQLADLFGEIVTLILRTGYYVPDSLRSRGGEISATDQWSRPTSWPRLGLAACDCEDSSNLIQEIIHIFQTIHPSNADALLNTMILVANHYCNILVLGSLLSNESNQYEGHAYVCCMDNNYIEAILANGPVADSLWPTLVIETTNYSQTVWHEDYWKENSKSWLSQYNKELKWKEKNLNNHLKHFIHCKIPAERVNSKKFYGAITQLHLTDGISVICLSKDRKSLGIDAYDFFMLKLDSTNFKIQTKIDNINQFVKEVCADFAPSYAPTWTHNDPIKLFPPHSLHFMIRTENFNKHKEDILKQNLQYITIPLYDLGNGSFTYLYQN